MKEEILLAKLIYQLYQTSDEERINNLLKKLKGSGNIYLLKKALPLLEDFYFQEHGVLRGELETAFDFDEGKILENFLGKKIKIEKKKINEDLILGGIFRTKSLEIDFSFKNFFERWKI